MLDAAIKSGVVGEYQKKLQDGKNVTFPVQYKESGVRRKGVTSKTLGQGFEIIPTQSPQYIV